MVYSEKDGGVTVYIPPWSVSHPVLPTSQRKDVLGHPEGHRPFGESRATPWWGFGGKAPDQSLPEKRYQHGFTLLELLLALAIFSVMSIMAYQGLDSLFRVRERITDQTGQITELQRFFILFGRDVEQMVSRPVLDEEHRWQAAFWTGHDKEGEKENPTLLLVFTRSGWRNPLGRPRSGLQRVAYLFEENTVRRRFWRDLDRAPDPPVWTVDVLTGVERVSLRFLGLKELWHERWPPPDLPNLDALPYAVEIVVEKEGWGKIRRVYQGLVR
jgi:general secretion pathway protein J